MRSNAMKNVTQRARDLSLALAFTATALAATPVAAQIDDNRWLAFLGCWSPADGEAASGLLCFRPTDGGVEMSTVVSGEVVSTERVVADGEPRSVLAEGCDGTESVTFSSDGRRAFTASRLVCGDETRAGTGVMALVAPTRWVDVRALDVLGERVAWAQSYDLVGLDRLAEEGLEDPQRGMETAVRAARVAAAGDIDLSDVAEAVGRIADEATVAWIAARQSRFDLDANELVRLADAGMPEAVIDVVVAVSYPERFVVAPELRAREVDRAVAMAPRVPVGIGYRPYRMWDAFYSPWRFGYSAWDRPYGLGYGYGYGPGYGYGYGYGYAPVVVRVEPRNAGGRVVAGRGYSSRGAVSDGRTGRPRSDDGGGAGSGSMGGGARDGASGSAGAAPASGSSGGRTAKPRRRGGE
jgi:hypothetical protein